MIVSFSPKCISTRTVFKMDKMLDSLPRVEGASLLKKDGTLVLFGGCKISKACRNSLYIFEDELYKTELHAQEEVICPQNCTNRGVCQSNQTCFCEPGFTGDGCQYSYAQYAYGVLYRQAIALFVTCFVIGILSSM